MTQGVRSLTLHTILYRVATSKMKTLVGAPSTPTISRFLSGEKLS